MKIYIPLILAVFSFCFSKAFAQDSCSGLAALRMLAPQFQNGILRLSADNANPNPETWYVVARDSGRRMLPTNITISGGGITSIRPTLNPRTLITGASPMELGRIRFDSTDAWREAQNFSNRRGRRLGSVSFNLQQEGSGAAPIWSVWCYDPKGGYIGFLSILATTGSIIRTD